MRQPKQNKKLCPACGRMQLLEGPMGKVCQNPECGFRNNPNEKAMMVTRK